jgi:hypothetical protein
MVVVVVVPLASPFLLRRVQDLERLAMEVEVGLMAVEVQLGQQLASVVLGKGWSHQP